MKLRRKYIPWHDIHVVMLEEAEVQNFKLMELRGEIDAYLNINAIQDKDRVLFKDATGLWHEAPHAFGKSLGVRLIGTYRLDDAIERLKTNEQVKIDLWDVSY